MGLNDTIDKSLKKTLWIWLPFFALHRLLGEFIAKYFGGKNQPHH